MLNLGEIDAALGLRATHSHTTGERSPSNVVYRESLWSLKSPLSKAEIGQASGVADRKTGAEQVQSLSRKYRVDFFCGFGSANGQGGFVLGGAMLTRIAKFGVPLGLDLYPPLPQEENDEEAIPPRVN